MRRPSDRRIAGIHYILAPSGTIITMSESATRHGLSEGERADAMAIRDGKILAVGTIDNVRARMEGNCEVIDLNGMAVVPGFNDSHAHLIETGEHLDEPDLRRLKIEEIAERLYEYADELPPDATIVCGGVDEEAIPQPAIDALDGYFPGRPVVLFHHSGHSAWDNRKAFESIGLSEVLGTHDELSHVAADAAGAPVGHIADPYEYPPVKRLLRARQREKAHASAALATSAEAYHSAGITSAQDNTWYPDAYSIIQEEVRDLSVTNWAYGFDPASLPEMLRRCGTSRDGASDNFRIGPVKFFIDGAFSTHNAWLWEPYRNDGENCGTGLASWEIIRRIERYVASGRQTAFHVAADRGVSELCDALELLERRYPWIPELRIRFEHAQPSASGNFLSDLQNLGEHRAMRAHAEFQEKRKGALEPGKDADFVVLNRNPLHLGACGDEIEVEMTVARGKVVYTNKAIPSLT